MPTLSRLTVRFALVGVAIWMTMLVLADMVHPQLRQIVETVSIDLHRRVDAGPGAAVGQAESLGDSRRLWKLLAASELAR